MSPRARQASLPPLARRLVLSLLTGLAALALLPQPAQSSPEGRQLAGACASCHQGSGQQASIPPLTGLAADQMVQLMRAYRSGERASQVMHVVANALTPEETLAIARYLTQTEARP